MKTPALRSIVSVISFLALVLFASSAAADVVHTPTQGTPERTAILASLHAVYTTGSGPNVKFLVHHFKVHQGWAWIAVVPLDKTGTPEGDEWPSLLHLENGRWVIIDMVALTPADDPVGPNGPSAKLLRALQKKYPALPGDILPAAQ